MAIDNEGRSGSDPGSAPTGCPRAIRGSMVRTTMNARITAWFSLCLLQKKSYPLFHSLGAIFVAAEVVRTRPVAIERSARQSRRQKIHQSRRCLEGHSTG